MGYGYIYVWVEQAVEINIHVYAGKIMKDEYIWAGSRIFLNCLFGF
jgi:hypothetical protein